MLPVTFFCCRTDYQAFVVHYQLFCTKKLYLAEKKYIFSEKNANPGQGAGAVLIKQFSKQIGVCTFGHAMQKLPQSHYCTQGEKLLSSTMEGTADAKHENKRKRVDDRTEKRDLVKFSFFLIFYFSFVTLRFRQLGRLSLSILNSG